MLMEASASNSRKESEPFNAVSGFDIFNEQYERSLDSNREKQQVCTKHKDELKSVQSHLETLPNELSYDVMIPIGSQGLMRGKMVHTNEILTLIGDNWYVKTSAKHAVDMCQRRIERCDELLNEYEKEKELIKTWRETTQEVFRPPDENSREIYEEFDEDKEKEWRERHRENVKKHYLELAKLKNKENKVASDDENALQRRLDELEMQEELEDELIRSGEDVDEQSSDSDDTTEAENESSNSGVMETNSLTVSGDANPKRRVSFSQVVQEVDLDSEPEEKPEPLKIYFHHSTDEICSSERDVGDKVSKTSCELDSPSDVYTHYASLFPSKSSPKGILKQSSRSSSVEENSEHILGGTTPQWLAECSQSRHYETGNGDSDLEDEYDELTESKKAFGDFVVEHNPDPVLPEPKNPPQDTRPVSRFKASRQKKKH